jgi:hypothetical protein
MKRLILTMILGTAIIGPALFAQAKTPVKLPGTVKSAWGKSVRYKVTAPNILEVRGTVQDMDVIFLKDLPYNGEKTLIIRIRSFSGKFRWDNGKMFGVTLGDPNNKGSFLVPAGKKVLDRMVDGPFTEGEEVEFTLPADVVGKAGTITLAITTYCGAVFEIDFWFQ